MIAIQEKGAEFAVRWLAWCRERGIPHRVIDLYRSDAMDQLAGCRALLWHWSHTDQTAALFARQLTRSLEEAGMLVFPSTATSWHFDDKVGQSYLLRAIGAPTVPSYVFYDRAEARAWIETADYPLVFKLRGGAGSENVQLVRNRGQARTLVERAFGRGWTGGASRLTPLRERLWRAQRDRWSPSSLVGVAKGLGRVISPHPVTAAAPTQRGYVYFQKFISNNDHDIRVVVIGGRAFALKRSVREGDFRASGSGCISYDPADIPVACVEIGFRTTDALQAQSVAYDFVFDNGEPLIVEISYAFAAPAYRACQGWWDRALNWHQRAVRPEDFIIEDVVAELGKFGGSTARPKPPRPSTNRKAQTL